MLSNFKVIIIALISLSVYPIPALSHDVSTAHLNLTAAHTAKTSEPTYSGTFEMRLADLQTELTFDPDNDGKIYWSEVESQASSLQAFIQQKIQVFQTAAKDSSKSNTVCDVQIDPNFSLNKTHGEIKLVAPVLIDCGSLQAPYTLVYNSLGTTLPHHKLLLRVTDAAASSDKSQATDENRQHVSHYHLDERKPQVELGLTKN